MAALAVTKYNPATKAFYQKLSEASKVKNVALMLCLLYKMA